MPLVALRYDLRSPAFGTPHAELFGAMLEQVRWADEVGLDAVTLSEHHFTDGGFLPSPITVAAAVAAATQRIRLNLAAVLAPLHDPLLLAEDLAVLDQISGGRTSVVLGLGYRPEEFAALGVDRARRGALLEETVEVMRTAWSGAPVTRHGTTVVVRPLPRTPGGPMLFVGGSTEVAARRAARLRCGFYPALADPALLDAYLDECARHGIEPGPAFLPASPAFVHVSDDPDRDWERIAPHALDDATTYASWQTAGQRSVVESAALTVDDLRAEGVYRVVTPDECVALANSLAEFDTFVLHPLMGGLDPSLAWESLRRFERDVLPYLHRPAALP